MRNSRDKFKRIVLTGFIVLATSAQAAPDFDDSLDNDDTVSLRSDEAWEDTEPDLIHFRGHFELRANEWRFMADRATLHGRLDRPDTVVLSGSPARFELIPATGSRTSSMEGSAALIEYQREPNIIRMSGGAVLASGEHIMRSEEIEYEVDTDQFRAGGIEGVQFQAEPQD
jgi:lipopolysaccharide transport protein LptA